VSTSPPKTARVHNLTDGPIAMTLLAFALPTLASHILQSLNGSINAMWVGRLLGVTGLAATSNANLIMFMVFALSFGFGMAVTILIGQTMGQRDIDGVRRLVGAGVALFVLLGLVIGIGGWFGSSAILRLLATPADVYPQALTYARVTFLGIPAGLMILFLQMALRGTGDALTPLLLVIPGALIDIALNPVLILGLGPMPKMGIAGSATAGLIANYISLSLLFGYIYTRDLRIRLRGPELRYLLPCRDTILTILRKGAPMGVQMIVVTVASLAIMGLVNRHGALTAAAYGAANQLWTYVQMPAAAIGAAVSAMVAQNIGAGKWNRVDRIAVAGMAINLALTGLLVLSITLPDRFILSWFLGNNEAAIETARHISHLASWSYIISGVMMVLSAVPRANGATLAPLLIAVLALIPVRFGFAYFLEPAWGPDAIWWSFPVGAAVSAALTALYYRFGRWREIQLLKRPTPEAADELVQSEIEPAARVHPTS